MKNDNWIKIKRLTVPRILEMLTWQTKLDDEQNEIIWLPENKSITIWKGDSDTIRKSGTDSPDNKNILGSHVDMNSPGKITIYFENIGRCFWVCISELLVNNHKITPLDLHRLCEAAVFQVFTHEQFHHYCDVIKRITGTRGSGATWDPAEEALAVAWEWREVQRSLPSAKVIPSALFDASLSWWYDHITAPGYCDWKKFSHIHFFTDELISHLVDPSGDHILTRNRCNLGDWLYKMIENPEWCADAVRYYVEPHICESHLEVNMSAAVDFPDYFAKRIQSSCNDGIVKSKNYIDNQTIEYEGNVLLCGQDIRNLTKIHKTIKKMNGFICLRDNPIKSNVLGLLLISDCTGVKLDNKEVEVILNKYLPNTRGNKGVIDCQYELSDANLDDFAEL